MPVPVHPWPLSAGEGTLGGLLEEGSFFWLGFVFFWGDDYGGGYLVLVVEGEEFDA